jgi:hypothetical protein
VQRETAARLRQAFEWTLQRPPTERETEILERLLALTRRTFLQRAGAGLGLAALSALLPRNPAAAPALPASGKRPAKAKRIIYLHFNLAQQLRGQCYHVDQPCAALLADLKERGLLEDTLVVWAGEFGRTVYAQGDLHSPRVGRDHHAKCFSIWMAGGGVRSGTTYGETDEFGYNIVQNPVSFFDLNATLLHLLGADHTRLTFRFQGRDYRLTDVHGEALPGLLA